jgi:periplasmic divalent cation tolerance protein
MLTARCQLALFAETNDCRRMADEKLVISTAGSREEAARIATALIEGRLAACVNIAGPIDSIYRWQGKIERAQEFLMLVKTTSRQSAETMQRIRQLHSYAVAEAIEVSIDGGNAEYLRWISDSVR